jgi:hypothetical protein
MDLAGSDDCDATATPAPAAVMRTSRRENMVGSSFAGFARHLVLRFRSLNHIDITNHLVLRSALLRASRRTVTGEIVLTADGAAWNIITFAGLEHVWRLPLDGEGDFALLDRERL